MAMGTIIVNGKVITEQEFHEIVMQELKNKVDKLVRTTLTKTWLEYDGIFYEDWALLEECAGDDIDDNNITVYRPDEVVKYARTTSNIMTWERWEEENERDNDDDDEYGYTQYDEDNAVYLQIVREGLGL